MSSRLVTISSGALANVIQLSRSSPHQLETGGALFGFDTGSRIHVFEVTEPGPAAIRRPTFFLRDLEYTRARADEIWNRAQAQWIGEWHTHPDGPIAPSSADLRTYREHLQDPELGFTAFISAIVSFSPALRSPLLALWAITLEEDAVACAQMHFQIQEYAND